MHILNLGLTHKTAPLQLREKCSLDEERVRSALVQWDRCYAAGGHDELVILSTCNRIELYSTAHDPVEGLAALHVFFSMLCDLPPETLLPHLFQHQDHAATAHLFEVAAGLDSLVPGEPQILGQVARALDLARSQAAAGPLLNRLFRSALHAGKRARTETAIGRSPASVSSLAAAIAARIFPNISAASVVVLGAGTMAELAVEALRQRGVNQIQVMNRTLSRAQELAGRWNAKCGSIDQLGVALKTADILISSTGAPHFILTAEMVQAAMLERGGRPLLLIDIAVPRDIDPGAGQTPGVSLFDIDQLGAQLDQALAGRAAEAPKVLAILEQELAEFQEYLQSLEVLPVIVDLRQQAELIRREVLEKNLRHLPGLDDGERARIEAMTQSLVKKILHAPTRRLRVESSSPQAAEYADLTRKLFDLPEGQAAL